MKKIVKIALIILGGVIALFAIAQITVSPITKSYINSHGPELMGRRIGVEKLFINLFNASVDIEGITIYEADGTKEFVTCREFSTRLRVFPLFSKKFIVSRIAFDSLKVNILQNGDAFNFDDIAAHFADTTATASEEPLDWGVGIYNISLRHAHLLYNDLSMGGHWNMDNITLDIPGFYLSNEMTDAGLRLDFPDGGSLASQIKYDYADGTYDLSLSLREFTVAGLLPYFRQYTNISSLEGLLGGDVRIAGKTDNVFDFTVSGLAWLRGFDMTDDNGRRIIAADSVSSSIDTINMLKSQFILSEMTIYGMKTHYELYADSTHSFANIIREQAIEEDTITSPLDFRIGRLAMHRGTVEVTDHTPCEAFHYRIHDIEVDVRNIDMKSHCTMTAQATLHGKGTAYIHWVGSPVDLSYHNLTVELHNVDMTHFSPYTLTMFGHPFTHGTLSFKAQNVIQNKKLLGTNHLDIHNPKVDKKRKDIDAQYNIPIKTGLYVLTDNSGRMKMDLPVAGDLDSPEFSYKHIVVKAIVNTLVKVIASPVKCLAEALGMTADKMEYIDFDPAKVEFSSEQYDKMADLAHLVREKPEMRLSLKQKFNYHKALSEEAMAQLKQAYYLEINPSKAGMSLEMLEQEAAMEVDIKSLPLMNFADSLLTISAVKPAGTDIQSKALAIYNNSAADKLQERIESRNKMISLHLTGTLGLPDSTFAVQTMPLDSLKAHTSHNRYKVSIAHSDDI